MNLVIPVTFASGTKAKAAEVNANFAAVATIINGGLGNANFSSAVGQALDANKLSAVAGQRITTAKMENNAVDARVLLSDTASPGSDALRAVSGDHVRTLTLAQVLRIIPASSITNGMLAGPLGALITAASLGEDKLKITAHSVAVGLSVAVANTYGNAAANPSVNFPSATYDLLGIIMKKASGTNLVASVGASNAGTNWTGIIEGVTGVGGAGTWSGTAIFMFISKI